MGIAAYNRGTAAISRQIDAELRGMSAVISVEGDELDQTRAKLAAESLDLQRARDCIARLRATLAVERDESTKRENDYKERTALLIRSRDRFCRCWRKCSALVRAKLSPEQVDEWRRERGPEWD